MLIIIKSNEGKGLYVKLSIVIALFSYPMMILTCGKHNNCYSILVSRRCIIILIIFQKFIFQSTYRHYLVIIFSF